MTHFVFGHFLLPLQMQSHVLSHSSCYYFNKMPFIKVQSWYLIDSCLNLEAERMFRRCSHKKAAYLIKKLMLSEVTHGFRSILGVCARCRKITGKKTHQK